MGNFENQSFENESIEFTEGVVNSETKDQQEKWLLSQKQIQELKKI